MSKEIVNAYEAKNTERIERVCTYCGVKHKNDYVYFCSNQCRQNAIEGDKLTEKSYQKLESESQFIESLKN